MVSEPASQIEVQTSVTARVAFWVSFALITAMFGYALVAAFGNILGVFEVAAALEAGFSAIGFVWIGVSVLLPIAVYLITVLLGLGRTVTTRLLLLFLGLSIVSVWQINMIHFVHISSVIAQ